MEELLLHNSYLARIFSIVSKSLQVSKWLETADKKTKAEPKQLSYPEKVKMTSNKVRQMAVKSPKNAVIICPKGVDSEIETSEDARDTATRKISGNGLVMETMNPEGLKAFTENAKLKEAGLKASIT